MLAGFWDSVGGKARRPVGRRRRSCPDLLAGGPGGMGLPPRRPARAGHTALRRGQPSGVQVAAIVIALLAVAVSGAAVERAATPVLRMLEGYWPSWAGPLRRMLTGWLTRRAAAEVSAWQQAQARVRSAPLPLGTLRRTTGSSAAAPQARAGGILPPSRLEHPRVAGRPPGRTSMAGPPSPSGRTCALRRLPETTRTELRAARASLDAATASAIWGVLFCAFAPFTWLVVPAGLAVATVAVTAVIPARAQAFGDLIEAAFDLYRTLVYQQLRWPLPTNPERERAAGIELTGYLWRGSDASTPAFTPPRGTRGWPGCGTCAGGRAGAAEELRRHTGSGPSPGPCGADSGGGPPGTQYPTRAPILRPRTRPGWCTGVATWFLIPMMTSRTWSWR